MSHDRIHEEERVQTRSLEALDLAQRRTPFCAACGAPMVPVARGHALWLECPSAQTDMPSLRRLLRSAFGQVHTRRPVIEDAA